MTVSGVLHSRAVRRGLGAALVYLVGILTITATTNNDRVATIVRTVGSGSGPSEIWYVGVGDCRTRLIGATSTSGIGSMAKNASGTLYGVNYTGALVTIDPRSGQATEVAPITGLDFVSVRALTFGPGDALYAVTKNPADADSPNNLYRIEVATGAATHVGAMQYLGIQAMGTSPDGTVFVWDAGGHPFWSLGLGKVDLQTGTVTDVNPGDNNETGTTGTPKPDIQTLVFMSQLYGIGNGNVYTIDTTSGATTMECAGLTQGDGIGAEYVYVAWPE